MKKIIIIGAGFAGMACAIKAKSSNNEVILLEKNSEVGKKILVTGSGRCNYYHDNISIDNYHSTNKELLNKFIKTPKRALDFYSDLGIVPYIKDGYYYPSTKDATTIRDVLVKECLAKGVILKKNFKVTNIKVTNKVTVSNDKDSITGDYLVIATGSKSYYPETNSYDLIKGFVMNLVKPLPSLVQLNTKEKDYLKIWSGVRCNASVTSIENGHYIKTESGEIQLTDYGISGICVFNLTPHITRGLNLGKEELVVIDFVPFFKDNELIDYLNKYNSLNLEKTLSTILNKKVVQVILKKCALTDKSISDLNKREINVLLKLLKEFTVKVESTKGFSTSQVTAGGVPLSELNVDYSLNRNNKIYVVGELVDIDGDCGGYNITFATLSGITAGESLKRRCKDA